MQLKVRRSQRDAGIVSTKVIFCLDARADLSERERNNLARYKLYDQIIYNSEASKRHLEKSMTAGADASVQSGLKALGHLALAKMRLNVSVRDLERGQHIECASMEELLAAEEAIMQACQNLKTYLDVSATFDGSEMVVDFSGNEPQVVAQAIRPEPILAPPVPEIARIDHAAIEAPSQYDEADDPPPQDDFAYAGDIFGSIVSKVSGATGLNIQGAKWLVLGGTALALVFLVSMCHG